MCFSMHLSHNQSLEDSTHSIFHMLENYFNAFLILNHSLVTVNMVRVTLFNISHGIFLKIEMYPQVSVKTLNKDSLTKNLFILPKCFPLRMKHVYNLTEI